MLKINNKSLTSIFASGLLIFLVHGLSHVVMAESLQRSTLLGIAPEQTDGNRSVIIRYVIPNSTGSVIGLQAKDQINQVNDHKVERFSDVLTVTRSLKTGDAIQVDITRNDTPIRLRGSMQPRPYESSSVASVHYSSVHYSGNNLRSILYRPAPLAANEIAPAIFFVQGYTCDSIDYGMLPNVTTRQMMDQFAAAGYITYRIEKPGLGDSQSDRHCMEIDFTEESRAFIEGLKALKQTKNVDPEKIYIWGHSLGVLHAPVIAQQEEVAGIIGYGGVYKQWYDYLLDIYQVQAVTHFGTDAKQATNNANRVKPFLDVWLNSDMPWEELIKSDTVQRALNANLLPIDGNEVFNRHYTFFRDLNSYDFATLWRNSEVPLLMLHGSLDIQAINQQWAFDIVNSSQHPKSQAKVIEGAEHAFMRFDSQQQHMQSRRSGNYNPGTPGERFDKRIAATTLDWLDNLH